MKMDHGLPNQFLIKNVIDGKNIKSLCSFESPIKMWKTIKEIARVHEGTTRV